MGSTIVDMNERRSTCLSFNKDFIDEKSIRGSLNGDKIAALVERNKLVQRMTKTAAQAKRNTNELT